MTTLFAVRFTRFPNRHGEAKLNMSGHLAARSTFEKTVEKTVGTFANYKAIDDL